VHEGGDLALGNELAAGAGFPVPVISRDPIATKSLLGGCRAIISSRYHACVGALSQAVPTIGTGWTHKYRGLFEDYQSPDWLIENLRDIDGVSARLAEVSTEEGRMTIRQRLHERADACRSQVWTMLDRVRALATT
jgi:colanic acid/amylovoran biosynthesis protein